MSYAIIHIVNNVQKINYGIWNAVIFGTSFLAKKGVKSELWVCDNERNTAVSGIEVRYLNVTEISRIGLMFKTYDKERTLIVTHGSWGKPTVLGYKASLLGFKWLYVPHGMLEPWSMQQKKIKKAIYFRLFERRLSRKADGIRSVSNVEKNNLLKIYSNRIVNVPNGVLSGMYCSKDGSGVLSFLFMARLHHKKGVVELVNAWHQSMMGKSNFKLIIAGPDDGELIKIQPLITGNIVYMGPIYGREKEALLNNSHYYVLPSKSEGFPTSVVEAMGQGLIPIITEGCNFPEVFDLGLGYEITPDSSSIAAVFSKIAATNWNVELSYANHRFIEQSFTEEIIADKLHNLYEQILFK